LDYYNSSAYNGPAIDIGEESRKRYYNSSAYNGPSVEDHQDFSLSAFTGDLAMHDDVEDMDEDM
jgi:hypothetical protein